MKICFAIINTIKVLRLSTQTEVFIMFMDFIVPGIGDLFDLERFDADVIEKVSKY